MLVLASASPRRKELMAGLGLEFQVMAADVPEDQFLGEPAQDMVMRLSLDKASALAGRITSGLVIGADSTVVLEGEVLGKPADADDARRMLRRLSGTQHQVMTGVSVVNAATGDRQTDWMASDIKLRTLSDGEIDASIRSDPVRSSTKRGPTRSRTRSFAPPNGGRGVTPTSWVCPSAGCWKCCKP